MCPRVNSNLRKIATLNEATMYQRIKGTKNCGAKLTSDHVKPEDETGKKHPGVYIQRQGLDYLHKGKQVSSRNIF